MAIHTEEYKQIAGECNKQQVALVAVSKTKPVEDILSMYALGQRDFGENYVQELLSKYEQLPKDIRWHFIGHLQSNKVKYIAPFIHLIHGVDSEKLLMEINKQAIKIDRVINCLLQVHIAREETKFGFDDEELMTLLAKDFPAQLKNISLKGLMGMASFTDNLEVVRKEFTHLKQLFDSAKNQTASFDSLSMGMSADYKLAIECGSNMIRVGSLLFGSRN